MNKQKQNQEHNHQSNPKNHHTNSQNSSENPNNQPQWSAYSLALNIGFMIVIPILVFGIGGVLLDRYLKTFPIFVLVGFFLAMTSGLLIVYKKSKDIIDNLSKPSSKKSTHEQSKKQN